MIATLETVSSTLSSANFEVTPDVEQPNALLFESDTALGFVLHYETVDQLEREWHDSINALISRHQFALRRSGQKAWNAYAVLLCAEAVKTSRKPALQAIEEDLSGTRKIVRAGVEGAHDVIIALLPLLPLQNAPELPVIDMREEIRNRTTELPDEVLQAFFSNASEMIALQVIEEAQ
jgi:hypothetical protein